MIVGMRLVVVVFVICVAGIFILVGFGKEEGGVVAEQERGFILNLKERALFVCSVCLVPCFSS